jgi:DNA-directed RNA polymerase specialized sigma24 family protein
MKVYVPIARIDGAFYSEQDRRFFADVAGLSARIIAKRYRGYVEPGDLMGEAWVWAYERPSRLQSILDIVVEEDRARKLRSALCNHLDRKARREKAQVLGYEPSDECFYSTGILRGLLPDVYDREGWVSFSAPDNPVRTRGNPGEGNNWLATLADVAQALSSLSKEDQRILHLRYGVGDKPPAIALALGLTEAGAISKVNRALGRLRRELGGRRPDADPAEVIGSRAVMSNAMAQTICGV